MKSGILSAGLLFIALALAACFASSLEATAPGMVLLACVPALLAGAVAVTGEKRSPFFACLITAAASYVAWRAAASPVKDFGRSDAELLACGLAACFWSGWLVSRRVQHWAVAGLALLALVNVVVALVQWHDPAYTLFYAGRKTVTYPSGLYAHYNHFANFLLGVGFVAAGCGLLPGSGRFGRWMWCVVAGLCVGGIALSRSRGAWVALAVGTLVLLVCWLLDLKRRRVKWFGMAVIGVVTLLPIVGFGGWWGVQKVLAGRGVSGNLSRMMDDSGRLHFATVALDLMGSQSAVGGGSRSFSYEIFRHWDPREMWTGAGDIDFVHNEFLQAGTDYGWIGLILLIGLLFLVLLRGVLVLAVEPEKNAAIPGSALTAGALAGISAMLVQSMFSFVFHMAPDVMVLGLLIGIVISQPWPFSKGDRAREMIWQRPALWAAGGLAMGLVMLGVRDAQSWWLVARPGSPGLGYSRSDRYDALEKALERRPDFRLEKDAAEVALAISKNSGPPVSGEWQDKAFQQLSNAVERNPQDHASRLNMARALDQLGKFPDAEVQYRKLIPLLDKREMYYRARFAYGSHAFHQADALFHARRSSEALAWALEARKQMKISRDLCFYYPGSEEALESGKVEEFIHWLEEARITPDPDAVPDIGAAK